MLLGSGGGEAGPCNKWFPVNSSVPSWEVSDVLWALQAQAAQQLACKCAAVLWGHPQLARHAYDFRIVLLLLSWVFGSVYFLRVLRWRKVFQSDHVQTDLTWINLLWLDLGYFFCVLYSTLLNVVLLSVLLFLLIIGLALTAAFQSTAVKTRALTNTKTKPSSQPKWGSCPTCCGLALFLISLVRSFVRVP